jgi:hypothetical protein
MNFTGFTVDANYITGTGNASNTPFAADRSQAGDTVGFTLTNSSGGGGVGPGQTSATLIIQTNVTSYSMSGSVALIGGPGANMVGFAPTPEPSTLCLTLTCLPCLGFGWLRRRRQA